MQGGFKMTRKLSGTRVFAAAAICGLVLAIAPAALASKGGSGGGAKGASISLVVLDSADGLPHFGGQVTFDVSTTVTQPWVNLSCYQDGAWVSGQWHGFFPGYTWGQTFTLGPTPSWQGGAADCTARLVRFGSNGRETTLATTSFHAYE
jgi:hypothetical protein